MTYNVHIEFEILDHYITVKNDHRMYLRVCTVQNKKLYWSIIFFVKDAETFNWIEITYFGLYYVAVSANQAVLFKL